MSEYELRQIALENAVKSHPGHSGDTIIKVAAKYLEFLHGGAR